MNISTWTLLGWIIKAGILGFIISAVFAGEMKLPRNRFLIPYFLTVTVFLCTFVLFNKIDVFSLLKHNWIWGVLVGCVVGVLMIRHVQTQPASRQIHGTDLFLDLTWAGILYGIVDALFLNVMPVIAIWAATSEFVWAVSTAGRIAISVLAILASLLVTFAYHWGYPEFRGAKMRFVLLGNSIITLAFLVSGNPLGSLISHPIMHIAAVLRGAETTIQLPPHYRASFKRG